MYTYTSNNNSRTRGMIAGQSHKRNIGYTAVTTLIEWIVMAGIFAAALALVYFIISHI